FVMFFVVLVFPFDPPNARLQPRRLMISPAAVGCKPMMLIQPSPCHLPTVGYAQGKCAFRAGGGPNEILQPSASSLLRDRSPCKSDVRLHPRRSRAGARAPQREVNAGGISRDGGAVPRRPR